MKKCFNKPAASLTLIVLAAVLAAGCGDRLLSKEQRKLDDEIRQAVSQYPDRVNTPFRDGDPPLHLSLSYHLPSLSSWLLNRGADPNARDSRGQTALHLAVFSGPRAIAELIAHGANLNARDNSGASPLHLAAATMRADAISALLAAGADPNSRDNQGQTPLHQAATPQPLATPEEVEHNLRLLVSAGGNMAAQANNGSRPLHQAALLGSVIAARALLREGAVVDQPGQNGQTALHVAAVFGQASVAEVLLKAGADPNRRDDNGLTPLDRALRYPAVTGDKDGGAGVVDTGAVVKLLRSFGAVDQPKP